MTDQQRLEKLLSESIDIQTAILKLLANRHVADEKTKMKKATRLRRDFDLSDHLLVAITGVRLDNLRAALKREGLA